MSTFKPWKNDFKLGKIDFNLGKSTLNSVKSTLNLEKSTLNLEKSTLNLEKSTLKFKVDFSEFKVSRHLGSSRQLVTSARHVGLSRSAMQYVFTPINVIIFVTVMYWGVSLYKCIYWEFSF